MDKEQEHIDSANPLTRLQKFRETEEYKETELKTEDSKNLNSFSSQDKP